MTKHIRTSDKHTHNPGIYSILFYRGQGNDRLSVTALLLFPGRGTMLGRYSARQGNIALDPRHEGSNSRQHKLPSGLHEHKVQRGKGLSIYFRSCFFPDSFLSLFKRGCGGGEDGGSVIPPNCVAKRNPSTVQVLLHGTVWMIQQPTVWGGHCKRVCAILSTNPSNSITTPALQGSVLWCNIKESIISSTFADTESFPSCVSVIFQAMIFPVTSENSLKL